MSSSSRPFAGIATAIFLISMFLPWQHTRLGQDPAGFGSGGWVALIFVLIAAAALFTGPPQPTRGRALLATAMGALATIVCLYLLGYFLTNEESLFGAEKVRSADPAIGLFFAIASSLLLTVAAFFSRPPNGA